MYIEDFITRRFIISLIVGAFFATFLGWFAASYFDRPAVTTSTTPRTTKELTTALKSYDKSLPAAQQLGTNFTITHTTHEDKWWYLVDVHYSGDQPFTTQAILADFANSAQSLKVVLGPNQSLPTYNTSDVNIPYDMIETIDKSQGVKL